MCIAKLLQFQKVLMVSKENEDNKYGDLGQRISALFFFATPHSAEDFSVMLNKMQLATNPLSSRQGEDLNVRDRGQGQSINFEFDQKHREGLHLCSIYETGPTEGVGIIVGKECATLGECSRSFLHLEVLISSRRKLSRRTSGEVYR